MLEYAISVVIVDPLRPSLWNDALETINHYLTTGWAPLRETLGPNGTAVFVWYRQVTPDAPEDDDEVA